MIVDISVYNEKELPRKSKSLIKRVWFFIRPFKITFFLLSLNRTILAAVALSSPIFINYLVDFINSENFKGNETFGYYYLLGIFAVFCIGYIAFYLKRYDIFFRNDLKRRITIFATIYTLNLPLSWHENQGTGNKIQKIIQARLSFNGLMDLYFGTILKQLGRFLIIIISLLLTTPIIICIMFLLYIIGFVLITYLKAKKIGILTDEANTYYEKVIGKTYEFSSSVFTVKFFNLIDFIRKKLEKVENIQMGKVMRMIDEIYSKWTYLNLYNGFTFLIISSFALYFLINGEITVGTFVMVTWFIKDIQDSATVIGDIQDRYINNKSGFMLLTSIFDEPIKDCDIPPYKGFPENLKHITFKNISFKYGNKEVLKNINLKINAGEKIALVGKSGSGKSTFVKLLMKQVCLEKGDIIFNDTSIKNIKKEDITKNISIVLQDTELFNVSIKDNILLDLELNKKDEEKLLKKVLELSYSNDFVDKLENKENTVIGEKGVKLSGGEKQRIGIARALARQANIIIFDEATSALDSESEKVIQKSMKEIFKGKTAFIIAHRLSTIQDADRILVFKDGEIVEDGKFDELINLNGEFAKLWKLQKLK